jgi:hypothetical protein
VADLTIDWYRRKLNSVIEGYANGATEVHFEGRITKFVSGEQYLRLISWLEAKIATLDGAALPDAPKSTTVHMDDYA